MRKLKLLAIALMAFVATMGASSCSLDAVKDVIGKLPVVGELLGGSEESTSEEQGNKDSESASQEEEEDKVLTIAEALELCGEPGNITTERYYVRGVIQTISNPSFGEMTIKDETGSIYVYGTYSADGSIGYAEMSEKPYKGDEVLLHCILQNYNGTKEIKNARLIEFKKGESVVDESDYTEMSIAEARAADKGTLVKVDGVVAKITYADKKVPNGVILADETQSIYLYDGDIAARVKVGNKITVLAERTWWILEKEQSAASKHGYQGACQLAEATLLNNDNGNNAFDKSWIEETTIKEIMENPVQNDITTTIYKVNALVEKKPGNNFVNYYFYDIDGKTGSYTYTQNSGADFTWVDEFDGKICTVYLTVLNAKSTSSGCLYRFLPIEIQDENYVFDVADTAKFAVEYYGVGQFQNKYVADPSLELNTTVSSQLLGFTGATLEYSSDNTDVIYFETVDGVTKMHCATTTEDEETVVVGGAAKITVTGLYNGEEYSETVIVRVEKPITYETITVADAITAEEDSTVCVKGIVGPSVVNKDGFYLFGEDGSMIAVLVNDTTEFVGLAIGHEIIIEGRRERYVDDNKASSTHGQSCIVGAKVLVNNFGSHEYSTEKFIKDKTPADFYALDKMEDHSTSVYVLTVKVNIVNTYYYSNINVTWNNEKGEETKITVYCKSAAQYEFLAAYNGQEVTVEIAPCNWNGKGFWAGCVLAVYTEDGKVYNELNFNVN